MKASLRMSAQQLLKRNKMVQGITLLMVEISTMGQRVKITTTKMRVKKMHVGMHPCPECHGTGLKKNVGRGAKKG